MAAITLQQHEILVTRATQFDTAFGSELSTLIKPAQPPIEKEIPSLSLWQSKAVVVPGPVPSRPYCHWPTPAEGVVLEDTTISSSAPAGVMT